MKLRSGNVDLAKFVAAVLIMSHHIYHIGVDNAPFSDCWIYVEFFLYITGYYTAKHYDNRRSENKSKEAITYTLKKFLPLFPYAFIVTFLARVTEGVFGLVLNGWIKEEFVSYFLGDFPFDLLLIVDSYRGPFVAPLWYLSAMLIMFPLFILFVQVGNRYLKMIICFTVPLIYYGWPDNLGNRDFPNDMLRVFAGLMIGVLIYEISVVWGSSIAKINKTLLTLLELAVFIYPIIGGYRNWAEREITSSRLYMLCFFINLLLCLPGFTYTTNIKGKFVAYLGKLSMPVFIFHWYIGSLVDVFGDLQGWSSQIRVVLYYSVSIVVATVVMGIIGRWKWFQDRISKPVELPD